MTYQGCIDSTANPFARQSWIEQGYGLTDKRPTCLAKLFGQSVQAIKQTKPDNENRYPAFVGVRWGFACVQDEVLVATDKWHQRHTYDAWGNPLSSGSQARQWNPRAASAKPQPATSRESSDANATAQHASATDAPTIAAVRDELAHRRQILISAAEDASVVMDPVERRHILEYLRDGRLPTHPTTTHALLQELVSSALSINQPPFRTRSRLTKVLGEIPLGSTIGSCLAKLLNAESLLRDATWEPVPLMATLTELHASQPTADAFIHSVINTGIACARTLEQWVAHGLKPFYERVEAGLAAGPEAAWTFLQTMSKPIDGVGPVLMADFLKNSGFHRLVKLDQRLQREFPDLLGNAPQDAQRLFIEAWHLADQLGMAPFVLDHLLYQWGNARLSHQR